ncbi:type 11 methyltransferase [Brachyspira suanatina]|uniref:Type 11 methyltransferase n=1 Tax=Brachyspira suanatina TaxID=381802 RepID=A0A0G4K640_9SPIR|nr:class I SAM-dependent methyltransferase [Brachyspira suanatina]CRF32903.1 type 11 methyltransferase [Brachyspira suanatina]
MPRNIIDKLAWWIPNKAKREQFKNDINKAVIDSLINMPKKELIETFPELYNHISNTKTRHSNIVTKYLSGLKGIEIGGSAHADFGIDVIHVNIEDENNLVYENAAEQIKYSGIIQKTDIIASGDDLPFKDNTVDFILSSHVLEHFFDPIKALKEWYRVTKKGGYILMLVPHKERTPDRDRKRTTLDELIDRHNGKIKLTNNNILFHYSVWITEDLLELCKYLNYNVVEYQDIDDAVGNGFTIVIQK